MKPSPENGDFSQKINRSTEVQPQAVFPNMHLDNSRMIYISSSFYVWYGFYFSPLGLKDVANQLEK